MLTANVGVFPVVTISHGPLVFPCIRHVGSLCRCFRCGDYRCCPLVFGMSTAYVGVFVVVTISVVPLYSAC